MPNWTKEQQEAIDETGKNIIVSAGAGSGKTAVLSERVIKKLENIDINKLLILTFTKEAANEMKERIRKKIKKNENLKKQLDMIDSAYITTFDSYSLSLVKKYYYLLNISPNVGIIDSSIINIKKEENNTKNKERQIVNPTNITIKKKKKEMVGPRIKKCKTNKTEDRELQIACEDKEERKERIKEEKKLKKKEKQRKKEEELKNKNLIYKIDDENYNCADCGKQKSTYLSINNGITLCDSCSQQHKILGNSISYIKNINDKLDEYLFNFIVFGSNTRFN